jgi:magnesium-protoporphyrin O-methyltransferase
MSTTYETRRGEIETYFDRTAVDAWKRFAGEAPLGRIRQSVRDGRTAMREAMLSRLPENLHGWRILDAGCGAGAMSVQLARRGARVLGIDLAREMIAFAGEVLPADCRDAVEFRAGDMLARDLGTFDAVIAMDSLIHYRTEDAVAALETLADRTRRTMIFTFAPRTPLLTAMHLAGRLFPRAERAPAIVPAAPRRVCAAIAGSDQMADWRIVSTARVAGGFYTSQWMEVARR